MNTSEIQVPAQSPVGGENAAVESYEGVLIFALGIIAGILFINLFKGRWLF